MRNPGAKAAGAAIGGVTEYVLDEHHITAPPAQQQTPPPRAAGGVAFLIPDGSAVAVADDPGLFNRLPATLIRRGPGSWQILTAIVSHIVARRTNEEVRP